jgi:hypothetical protein
VAGVVEALLWAAVLIAVAVAIACGTRVVAWIVEGGPTADIWRAAGGILLAATGGGAAITKIRGALK